jgi:hypothetical protein
MSIRGLSAKARRKFIRYSEYAIQSIRRKSALPMTISRYKAPPLSATPTDYDWACRIQYLRLLDADAAGADWRDAASKILDLDVVADVERAHAIWSAHLARARWMTTEGYRHYLTIAPGDSADRDKT